MIPEYAKNEIITEALLIYANDLKRLISYHKAETEKAWDTAKKWREEDSKKLDIEKHNSSTLLMQIENLGCLIPVNTGGTMEHDPHDAILAAAISMLSSADPSPPHLSPQTEKAMSDLLA